MTDGIQASLHTLAVHQPVAASLARFCASLLLFVLLGLLAVAAWLMRRQLTWKYAARVVVSLTVATVLTLLTNHLVLDPRPFVVEHYSPLAHASADNGFPSDHTLVAALFVGWAGWLNRRWSLAFALGLAAIILGRLAIGAHHSLDVLGSLVFAALGIFTASKWPFPPSWQHRPLLPFLT
ncbi:phosphatase PAP2 family protein [Deinococcus hopiensis]|uniref:Undecaprenyl-diphosphatase n=1 Tax=Deinococcus hopiensis KR-140 TaxID=695939 RepID=A0A1W1VVE3_9DEIO|nr:phosphatase PAP2 family protein [Deinococcus hopiensis]SMB97210.1 undecaprenyl-diphosphatase [Deinococcus hopiensis KR-140]